MEAQFAKTLTFCSAMRPPVVDVGVGRILGVERRIGGCLKCGSEQGHETNGKFFYMKQYFLLSRDEEAL